MKKLISSFILIFCLSAQAEFSASGDLVSTYVFRGGMLADAPSIQPSVDIGVGSFGFNVWGSFAVSDRDVTKAADELDFTPTYSMEMAAFDLTLGYIYYLTLDNTDGSTSEIMADVSLKAAPLAFTFYYDIDLVKDFYASASYELSLPMFTFGATAGYHNSVSSMHFDFSVAREFGLGSITLSPYAVYSMSGEDINADNEFFLGVSFGF